MLPHVFLSDGLRNTKEQVVTVDRYLLFTAEAVSVCVNDDDRHEQSQRMSYNVIPSSTFPSSSSQPTFVHSLFFFSYPLPSVLSCPGLSLYSPPVPFLSCIVLSTHNSVLQS